MPSGEQILQHWWNIWLYLKHTFDISSVCVWVGMGVKQSTAPVKKWKQTSEPIGKHMATPDKRDRQKIKRAKILPKGKITTHILCFGDGSVWLQAHCEYGCSDKNRLHRSHRKALLWGINVLSFWFFLCLQKSSFWVHPAMARAKPSLWANTQTHTPTPKCIFIWTTVTASFGNKLGVN